MHSFEDSWSPIRSHEQIPRLSEESELTLHRLQAKPTGKLSGWLSNLIDENHPDEEQTRVDTWLPKRYTLIEASARAWIDAFFAELNKFVWEVNNSTASEKLTIAIETPKSTIELRCRRDPSSEPYKFTCYQGHLATQDWAILIRSYYESLQVFIMRSDILLALEFDQLSTNDLKPVAEFRAAVNGDVVQWALAGMPVSHEAIPAMARELFEDFINVALGKIKESDLFLPAQTKTSDTEVSSQEKKDQLLALVNDLYMWRTRDIVSKAINRDLDALTKLSIQPKLKLSRDAKFKLLHCQFIDLQASWNTLLASLQSICGDICSTNEGLQNESISQVSTVSEL